MYNVYSIYEEQIYYPYKNITPFENTRIIDLFFINRIYIDRIFIGKIYIKKAYIFRYSIQNLDCKKCQQIYPPPYNYII